MTFWLIFLSKQTPGHYNPVKFGLWEGPLNVLLAPKLPSAHKSSVLIWRVSTSPTTTCTRSVSTMITSISYVREIGRVRLLWKLLSESWREWISTRWWPRARLTLPWSAQSWWTPLPWSNWIGGMCWKLVRLCLNLFAAQSLPSYVESKLYVPGICQDLGWKLELWDGDKQSCTWLVAQHFVNTTTWGHQHL